MWNKIYVALEEEVLLSIKPFLFPQPSMKSFTENPWKHFYYSSRASYLGLVLPGLFDWYLFYHNVFLKCWPLLQERAIKIIKNYNRASVF